MDGRLTCVDPVAGAGGEEEGDAPKTLAAIEAEQNAPPPEPEPEPDGPMRALTAEEEKLGMTGRALKNGHAGGGERAGVQGAWGTVVCFRRAAGRNTTRQRDRPGADP